MKKLPFENLPNYEKIPLEWHLKVASVMGNVFHKANTKLKSKKSKPDFS